MTDISVLKQKLEQQYIKLSFDLAAALSDLRLNSFTKKYIKNILARITGFIEEQTGVASNYCTYMNIQTKNLFEIECIKKTYSDSELEEEATIRNFWIVQTEGSRQISAKRSF